MPTVHVLKDFRGSPDGIQLVDYVAGAVVEMTDHLANIVLADGSAELAEAPKATKAAKGAPATTQNERKAEAIAEDKALDAAPENKAPLGRFVKKK